MKYTIRPGVLLREIAGDSYLLAAGAAKSVCPPIQQLNDTGAFFWRLLEKGTEEETMFAEAVASFEIDEDSVRKALPVFLDSLIRAGYLIPEKTE